MDIYQFRQWLENNYGIKTLTEAKDIYQKAKEIINDK